MPAATTGSKMSLKHRHADRAERDAQRGDADLHGADEARRVVQQPQRGARAAAAVLRQLLHLRARRGQQRVLGDDEEGVRQQERQDTQDPERGHRAASGEWGSPAAAGASCIAGDDSRSRGRTGAEA